MSSDFACSLLPRMSSDLACLLLPRMSSDFACSLLPRMSSDFASLLLPRMSPVFAFPVTSACCVPATQGVSPPPPATHRPISIGGGAKKCMV